jgi:hypothetical protein
MNITEQLRIELLHVDQWSAYLSADHRDDMQVLTKAAEVSNEIILTIKLAAEKPYNKELIEFLDKINPILERLCKAAKRMDPEPLNKKMLSSVTGAFSTYVDEITIKPGVKKIRKMAGYIPYINSIIDCCETIPKRWNATTRNEKIALALAATLLLTSVALTIAFYASPVLAAIPLIGLAIAGISAMASACYEQALINPQKKVEKSTHIKNIVNALERQKKSVNELLAVEDSEATILPQTPKKMKQD